MRITSIAVGIAGDPFNAGIVNTVSYSIDNGTQYPFLVTASVPNSSDVLFNLTKWTSDFVPLVTSPICPIREQRGQRVWQHENAIGS